MPPLPLALSVLTRSRPRLPIRSLSFSYDGQFLASASEDPRIDVSNVETGECADTLVTRTPVNSVAWSPKAHVLAVAGDAEGRSEGVVKVYGL